MLISFMEAINSSANGSLEVSDIRPSNRSEVVRVKDTPAEKSYTIRYKIEAITDQNFDDFDPSHGSTGQ